MAFRALVKIGNYELPEPTTYSAITSDLVDSARNVQGRMVGSVVRSNVSKIEITWRYLTAKQWSDILKRFRGSSGGNFINLVEFYDQSAAGWVTKEMYVSDRKSGMWRRDPKTGDVMGWTDCSLNLIEV